MVTKFNKILSRDSNQSTCQRPTPSPSSGFYQVFFKITVPNQWKGQSAITTWVQMRKRHRIKIKQDLRQQSKETVTRPQWEPNHGASPEEACHCSLTGWGTGYHNLLKQGSSSLLMFKWSAISSWITWSIYLDVVRGYCCALEAMLKICVVLYHGWQIHVTKTEVLVVSLDPGFNGMNRLSSDDLTTLKDNAIHVWHFHTRDIQTKNNGILSIKYTHMHIYENRHHGDISGFSSIPPEQRGWPLRKLWRPRTHSYPFPLETKKKKLPPR
jgi:hypothetical protein